jgi:hypothetical protein
MLCSAGLTRFDPSSTIAALFCPVSGAMSVKHLITAASCKRSARLFNLLAVATTLLSVSLFSIGHLIADKKLAFLPMAMSLPPIMIWLAASIFVYA